MCGVSEVERCGDRREDSCHFTQRKRAVLRDERLPMRRERDPFEILHHDVIAVPGIVSEQVERTDVLVLQVMHAVKHLLHRSHLFGVMRQLGMQQLEHDGSLANQIAGLPDLAHAAASETFFQTEATQFVARSWQSCRRDDGVWR